MYLVSSKPLANIKLNDGPQDDYLYYTSDDSLFPNCKIENNNGYAGKYESNCQTFGLILGIPAYDIQSQEINLDKMECFCTLI